jgi:hypothetical protein
MSKKHFIALADVLREHNRIATMYLDSSGVPGVPLFSPSQIHALADFCQAQNRQFNRERWLAYIAGECGPNGGKK